MKNLSMVNFANKIGVDLVGERVKKLDDEDNKIRNESLTYGESMPRKKVLQNFNDLFNKKMRIICYYISGR